MDDNIDYTKEYKEYKRCINCNKSTTGIEDFKNIKTGKITKTCKNCRKNVADSYKKKDRTDKKPMTKTKKVLLLQKLINKVDSEVIKGILNDGNNKELQALVKEKLVTVALE
jgi:hypothetical protein